jgi:hypothetical protein
MPAPPLSGGRLDQHVQQGVGAKADFIAGQTDDARITRPKHFDLRPAAQSELFELVNVVGVAEDAGDTSAMTDRKVLQRNGLTV